MADGQFNNSYMDDEAVDDATRLETLYLALFVNNITPGPTTGFGSYTEPTYTGYARQAVTGATPGSASGGTVDIACDELTFTCSGTGGSDQVYGCFLVTTPSGAGTAKGGVKLFSSPVNMSTSGDTLKVTAHQINSTP